MRLIDADALRKRFLELAQDDWNKRIGGSWAAAFEDAADMVNDAPTVDALQLLQVENDILKAKLAELQLERDTESMLKKQTEMIVANLPRWKMADCAKCASSSSCERVWKGMNNPMCVGFEPIIGNADRIRSMTDEELTKVMIEGCPYREDRPPLCGDLSCSECILDWLQQEAES